jgi:putative ABC transport system substrate-binding protein
MLSGGDSIEERGISSLIRQGGNLTGLSVLSSKLSPLRLTLLKEVKPTITKVAIIFNPNDESESFTLSHIEATAQALGVTLYSRPVRAPGEFEQAFNDVLQQSAMAVISFSDVFSLPHRTRIIALANQHQLPVIYELRTFAEAGGLMAYGPSLADMFRRAAAYVDQILKGAKPADLPMEEFTSFELTINLQTARSLGLTIPPSVLSRASQVIQ